MRRNHRITAICLLVFATVGLGIAYAEADRWTYPDAEAITSDPGSHAGQQVLVFGRVASIDRTSGELRIVTGDPDVDLRITNVPPSITETVDRGAAIQVYGPLRESPTVLVADEIVVDYGGPSDRWYVYSSSLLGGLLAAGSVLWYWRPDIRRLRFVPRSDR